MSSFDFRPNPGEPQPLEISREGVIVSSQPAESAPSISFTNQATNEISVETPALTIKVKSGASLDEVGRWVERLLVAPRSATRQDTPPGFSAS